MKKLLFLPFILLILTGCFSTIKPSKQIDDNQKIIAKEEKKVDNTLVDIEKNDKGKKIQTSALAQGIQYSLNQVTNPPIQVDTAKSLNERVVSIVGSPHIDEINRIKATVDLLNSAVEEERKKGLELLAKRDELINKLQKEKVELNEQYDDQLWQLTDKAKEVAKEADQNKAVLDSMSGMFGLNAVFWGLKKFFISALTAITIFIIVFVLLRLLATVHPAAGAAFSIFNMLGSTIISIVKALLLKLLKCLISPQKKK
jgi:Zn-dependent oligopeptidase